MHKTTVLGLGSNFGDRLGYIRKTVQILKSQKILPHLKIQAISPLYESQALLPESAPKEWNRPFLNLNILCETLLSPQDLLTKLKNIEVSIGRQNRGRWALREIDIDILTWGTEVIHTEELKIPHPSLMHRPFVMMPLADLCPHWRSPLPEASHLGSISELVSPWRHASYHDVPFQTHRSSHFLCEIVGILNLTPDSFSDGNQWMDSPSAMKHIAEMVSQGVTIVDLGAESTRPGATATDPKVEWARLEPVLQHCTTEIARTNPLIQFSIDTRHPWIAKQAIKQGVHWINDVTGFRHPEMRRIIADSEVHLVLMHSLSVPPSQKEVLPNSKHPITTLLQWAKQQIQELAQHGISRERIILDPGIGFGKTPEQNWEILRNIQALETLGVRILIGHSRKSFLSTITQTRTQTGCFDRDIETLLLSVQLATKGVSFLRIHHTDWNLRALKTWAQIDGVIR